MQVCHEDDQGYIVQGLGWAELFDKFRLPF